MENEINTFLDKEGRVIRWPKKRNDKLNVLKYIQGKFEENRKYTESEVNKIIKEWHIFNDHALVRRELYDNYLINRTGDGREYWIEDEGKQRGLV